MILFILNTVLYRFCNDMCLGFRSRFKIRIWYSMVSTFSCIPYNIHRSLRSKTIPIVQQSPSSMFNTLVQNKKFYFFTNNIGICWLADGIPENPKPHACGFDGCNQIMTYLPLPGPLIKLAFSGRKRHFGSWCLGMRMWFLIQLNLLFLNIFLLFKKLSFRINQCQSM